MQEYIEELYKKKVLMTQITMMVWSLTTYSPHMDILKCEVEGLRKHFYKKKTNQTKTKQTSGGDRIPVKLFQILKYDAVKVLYSIRQQIWKTQEWPQDWKMSVFIPIPMKGNAKECSNYCTVALISHASKVMLKILLARLQQRVN